MNEKLTINSTLSLMKNISSQTAQLQKMFSAQGIEQQLTSANQLNNMIELIRRETEEKSIKRKGAEAQIESTKILIDQREEMEVMREAINALLMHNLEQSKQQTEALQIREKIEAERYRENTRLSKIAAWAGAISAIFAALAVAIQLNTK